MPEFFLELFSEEIPARMQQSGATLLSIAIHKSIPQVVPLNHHPKTYFGPRRIALAVEARERTMAVSRKERGPRINSPEQAVNGFLKKHGATRDQLHVENDFLVLSFDEPERLARDVILERLPAELAAFPWVKSMRWGQAGDFSWVRPLRSIVCLLDGETIQIQVGPITASNETEGHRARVRNVFSVSSCTDWLEKLYSHKVIADHKDRCNKIWHSLDEQANLHGLTAVKDDSLLEEVAGLVEWPVSLIGKIDESFMSLPPEVRELSMKVNQKYFALRDAAGNSAPHFAFVANLDAADGGAAIVAGNERVLRARLADARHFWDRDLRTPLDALLPQLDGIVFQARIGTQRQRAGRISALAREIAQKLHADGEDGPQAGWAGLLCKADLVTGMVGEFPELQGVMGGYYAERNPREWDGAVVGPAIKTHYQPKGPQDDVPRGVVPVSVALADKIDTLREFFRIGEVPTGSGDPYALRRAALGVIRIILENELRLPLRPLLAGDEKLFAFIIERLRVKLRGEGRRFDVLDAVLGAGTDDDLTRVMKRVDAVSDFLARPDGANLIVAYRRAANILRIEDAKDGPHRGTDLQRLSAIAEETDLTDALTEIENQTIKDFLSGRYEEAMAALARLRAPVDVFFDKVTVNAAEPELRLNRLRLLAHLRDTMNRIADFSRVEN